MRFINEDQARQALERRVKTSPAPALALSVDPERTYRLIEANSQGEIILRSN